MSDVAVENQVSSSFLKFYLGNVVYILIIFAAHTALSYENNNQAVFHVCPDVTQFWLP